MGKIQITNRTGKVLVINSVNSGIMVNGKQVGERALTLPAGGSGMVDESLENDSHIVELLARKAITLSRPKPAVAQAPAAPAKGTKPQAGKPAQPQKSKATIMTSSGKTKKVGFVQRADDATAKPRDNPDILDMDKPNGGVPEDDKSDAFVDA